MAEVAGSNPAYRSNQRASLAQWQSARLSNERPAGRSRCEAPRPVSPVGNDARPSNGNARVRSPHRPPRVMESVAKLADAVRNFFPLPHLALKGRRSGLSGRNDRKVVQVRILPLSRRAITITGDEAHGEHDNTHYHTLPHSGPTAAGYRLLSARSGFESRHPPPPVMGRSAWVTASETPQPARETFSTRRCSSVRQSTAHVLCPRTCPPRAEG